MKQYIIKCLKEKAIRLLIATTALMLLSQVLYAQEGYDFYLQNARQRLAEGDCSRAEASYNTYKDMEYDDLISCAIEDDGWGGVDALFITNYAEIELGVGVEIVANGTRKRYAVRVSPDKKSQVGGLFGGGNVTSYNIEFVERF